MPMPQTPPVVVPPAQVRSARAVQPVDLPWVAALIDAHTLVAYQARFPGSDWDEEDELMRRVERIHAGHAIRAALALVEAPVRANEQTRIAQENGMAASAHS